MPMIVTGGMGLKIRRYRMAGDRDGYGMLGGLRWRIEVIDT